MKQKTLGTKPTIGISSSLLTIESGSFLGSERAFVGYDYIEGIVKAGGVPVVIPVVEDLTLVAEQMQGIKGLLLSGGHDVSPQFYGEEPAQTLQGVNQKRDQHERELIRYAHQTGQPLLGICRGLQLLNVTFGGTLYQDIDSLSPNILQHMQKSYPYCPSHQVELVKGTLLQKLFEQDELAVNSYHHQAIKKVAPDFLVNARSKDGMIEGIEKKGEGFVVAVQWHPEMMFAKSALMFKLFEGFVQAAKNQKEFT